jgi:hypothetical protein
MNGAADVVQTKLANAVRVPAKALFTERGKAVVYVKSSAGFRAQEVRVRARNTDEIAVEGLAAGATVAMVDPEASDK